MSKKTELVYDDRKFKKSRRDVSMTSQFFFFFFSKFLLLDHCNLVLCPTLVSSKSPVGFPRARPTHTHTHTDRQTDTEPITMCYNRSVPKNYRRPVFVEKLRANLTDEGLVSFECKVVGFPTPELAWLKDGQDLRPGDVYQLYGNQVDSLTSLIYPTNIAGVNLVMGCSVARAGVGIVG